ncbi:MAG: hypothetical protein ACYC6N_25185 [Pirellulaceae bacterium]
MTDQDPARALSGLEQFVLLRLLAAGKPPAKFELDKALRRYFAERVAMPAAAWRGLLDESLERLQLEGHIQGKPLRLTDSGRSCALRFLGVDSLPMSIKWLTLRNRYLIAVALNIRPHSKAEWDRLGTAEGLRAAILTRHYGLPLGPVPAPARVLHALAWLQLTAGHSVDVPLEKDFTRNAVLGVTLLGGRISKKPEEALAAQATGATGTHPEKIREALICNWLGEEERGVPSAPSVAAPAELQTPFDLDAFAANVLDLARTSAEGRFGDNKVFIVHVWNRFRQQPAALGMTREMFDRHLVDANRDDLLTLSRADLVSGMDHDDVQRSEIRLPHSSFHFIRTDR